MRKGCDFVVVVVVCLFVVVVCWGRGGGGGYSILAFESTSFYFAEILFCFGSIHLSSCYFVVIFALLKSI